MKQLDLADGQLKKTVAIKGLREGERISLCGQYAIHTGSVSESDDKNRPFNKQSSQAECTTLFHTQISTHRANGAPWRRSTNSRRSAPSQL